MDMLRRSARAWSILTWKHWAWATGTAILAGLVIPFQYFNANSYWVPQRMIFHMPWYVFFSSVFLFAIAWVESGSQPRPNLWRYAGAALMAGLLCVSTAWLLAPLVQIAPQRVVEGEVFSLPKGIDRGTYHRLAAALSPGLDGVFYGLLSTLIYARLRNSRRAALALAQAEFGRAEANRSLLASKLAAARTEVDPDAVIERLEAIGRMYESDPEAADARLDELIAFLRDAIPRLRFTKPVESA